MEIVRCKSETRGGIGTKGAEGATVCDAENTCDKEVNSNEGKEGPDDDSEERSPDNERERVRDAFEKSEASNRG